MSYSVQPHGRQPTRLPHPWDSPGKNTGVGCHFLLQCRKVKSEREVAQSCPTLRDPMDCSLPGSSIHGILQARGLEWGAIAFSVAVAIGVAVNKENAYFRGSLQVSNNMCNYHTAWELYSWVSIPEKWKFLFLYKPVHEFYSNFTCNSHKLEATQMSCMGWKVKLLSNKWNITKS